MTQTIRLLPEDTYDSHDYLGQAVVSYNQSDLENRPGQYTEDFSFLELVDTGRVAVHTRAGGVLVTEVQKEISRTPFEERARYYFPDGTIFYEIRTKSITPTFLRTPLATPHPYTLGSLRKFFREFLP